MSRVWQVCIFFTIISISSISSISSRSVRLISVWIERFAAGSSGLNCVRWYKFHPTLHWTSKEENDSRPSQYSEGNVSVFFSDQFFIYEVKCYLCSWMKCSMFYSMFYSMFKKRHLFLLNLLLTWTLINFSCLWTICYRSLYVCTFRTFFWIHLNVVKRVA